ncbi:hypothetical protein COBT_000771 [Conglomerata obtusa]
MSNIMELIKNNEHEKIIALEGNQYNQYKTIAYLFLERYKEALEHAEKESYEYCYCLYKLRKYKKCVKLIKKINPDGLYEEKYKILLSQALYFMGYYNSSAKALGNLSSGPTYINFLAANNLAQAGTFSNKINFYKVFAKDDFLDIFNNVNVGKLSVEENEEVIYNNSFKHIYDENTFKKYLEECVDNTLCYNQLNNINGNYDILKEEHLTKKQKDIILHNKKQQELHELQHFQKYNYEFAMANKLKTGEIDIKNVKCKTDNLFLIKAVHNIKRKNNKAAKKCLEAAKDTKINELLSFLANSKAKEQNELFNILKNIQDNL